MNARLSKGLWGLGIVGAIALAGVALLRSPREGAAAPAPAPVHASEEDREEPLGELTIPDVALTDQRGQPVHLYRDLIQGKRVAMSFIFTRCTTICPPIGSSFSRIERLLGARAGKEVSLISVTLDADYDTPERLREFAERYHGGAGWTLLTGNKADIDGLLKALTVYTSAKEEHAPIVLLGDDATGRWVRAFGLSSPQHLLAILDRAPAAAAPIGAPN